MRIREKVYTSSMQEARQSGKLDYYRESFRLNIACASAINKAIGDSNYEPNHYDLKTAVKSVIDEYGSNRVNWVLANTVQYTNDGRFSHSNKTWAQDFPILDENRTGFLVHSHPYVLDGFIDRAQEYTAELTTKKPSVTAQLRAAQDVVAKKERKPTQDKKNGLEI